MRGQSVTADHAGRTADEQYLPPLSAEPGVTVVVPVHEGAGPCDGELFARVVERVRERIPAGGAPVAGTVPSGGEGPGGGPRAPVLGGGGSGSGSGPGPEVGSRRPLPPPAGW